MSPAQLQRARLLTLVTAGVWLAGCGDAPPPATAPAGEAISLEMRDYRFRPQALRARAGRARVEVVNRGRLPHAFQLRLEGRERLRIPTVLPGERGAATTTLKRGSYRFACPIANHEELGMHGVLTVR